MVSFRVDMKGTGSDGLVDKVSNATLLQILRMKPGINDYYDMEGGELPDKDARVPVTLRVPVVISSAQSMIVNKLRKDPILRGFKSTTVLYKYATKLGAMIMSEKDYTKKFLSLEERKVKIIDNIDKIARINSEAAYRLLTNIDLIGEQMYLQTGDLKSIWGMKTRRVSFRPFPRWQEVLSEYSTIMYLSQSDVYRMALAYAFATEVPSLDSLISGFEEIMRSLAVDYEELITAFEGQVRDAMDAWGVEDD